MEFDSPIPRPEEEVPRVTQIVAEIMEYLSAEEISDASNRPTHKLSINRPSSPGPETPRPTKPPPRPPTPYPRPQPDSMGNMIRSDGAMPFKPKPLPGPPGPPPPYPPPPIPQALGKSHHGAELYLNNGDIQLRVVRVAGSTPQPKNRTLLKLSLEDQRWGGGMPCIAGAAKSNPYATEGCGNGASFKYDPTGRSWCAIGPILRSNGDNTLLAQDTASTTANSGAYEKQQSGLSIPRSFQDPLSNTIHHLNWAPGPDLPSEWEFSPKHDSASSDAHCNISAVQKPTVRDLFTHPKRSFSKLRSVTSMGSLKINGRVSSTSISSTSSSSTSSTSTSQRKHKGMEGSFLTWPAFKGTMSRF